MIYYGLKWLGLAPGVKWRNLFLALYLLTGLVVAGVFWLWKGVAYLGVALPFGMILGVIVYLIVISLTLRLEAPASSLERLRAYLLLGLVAAVIAHFVEINFGIAIASTRTYFWVSSALILLVGYILPLYGEYSQPPGDLSPQDLAAGSVAPGRSVGASQSVAVTGSTAAGSAIGTAGTGAKSGSGKQSPNLDRSKNRSAARSDRNRRTGSRTSTRSSTSGIFFELAPWLRQSILNGLLVGVALMTLGYLYLSNISRSTSALTLIWNSLTRLTGASPGIFFGLLALMLTTWIMGSLLFASEWVVTGKEPQSLAAWGKMILITLGVSLLAALVFWLWHAGGLAALNRSAASTIEEVIGQVRSSEYLLSRYYIYLLILVFVLGFFIAPGFATPPGWPATSLRWQVFSLATALAIFLVSFGVVAYTNLRIIQADISFKTAELFARPGSWPVAIEIYDHARNLAPNEDYYYLFLGRAYLEYAKTLTRPG